MNFRAEAASEETASRLSQLPNPQPLKIRAIRRAVRATPVLLVGSSTLAACVIDSDDTLDFTNQTEQIVWVAHNPAGPAYFRVPERLWVRAEPGERVVLSDGGCVGNGELVVATEPAESAVIDARPLVGDDVEVCAGDDWEWSGVGDYD